MKYSYWLTAILLLISFSCKKEEINHPPVAAISFFEQDSRIILNGGQSTDPDNDSLVYKWTADAGEITIENADRSTSFFTIPQLNESKTITIKLRVSDGEFENVNEARVPIMANYFIRHWGLGNILKYELSCNRDYEWYIDQMTTGTYASANCGPTSTTMAVKWYNPGFSKTTADARNAIRPAGGWWYTSDIIKYLNDNSVLNRTIALDNINVMKREIADGNIVILCLDMYYITYNAAEEVHKDKFYQTGNTGWGHFILVKGYKEVDDKTYYEVYDPNSWNKKYPDGTLKGKNRYYSSVDLDAATGIWWDYGIVITRNALKGKGLDISTIPDMPGR